MHETFDVSSEEKNKVLLTDVQNNFTIIEEKMHTNEGGALGGRGPSCRLERLFADLAVSPCGYPVCF